MHVYAALDGASVPGLLARLHSTQRLRFVCLYRGALRPDMAQVAPYLVAIEPESEFMHWLLANGWDNHWGVFLRTRARMIDVRKHLRNLNRVYGPQLQSLWFRYYDPRVLRAFLPLCESHQLPELFGPVCTWVVEAEAPGRAIAFAEAGGGVQSSDRSLLRGQG